MKDLSTKVVVTSPDGFYYREEHEWRAMSNTGDYFEKLLADTFALAQKLAAKGGGNLTAVFDAVADGKPFPTTTVGGFTHEAMTQFERHIHRKHGELLDIGEKLAKSKHQSNR